MCPAQAQAALRQRADQEAEMLVLALPDQKLVTDDEAAKHPRILCGLLGPALEFLEAADMVAVDEDLRHGAAAGDRADHARAIAVVERDLAVLVAQVLQQLLRAGAVAAAFARKD